MSVGSASGRETQADGRQGGRQWWIYFFTRADTLSRELAVDSMLKDWS